MRVADRFLTKPVPGDHEFSEQQCPDLKVLKIPLGLGSAQHCLCMAGVVTLEALGIFAKSFFTQALPITGTIERARQTQLGQFPPSNAIFAAPNFLAVERGLQVRQRVSTNAFQLQESCQWFRGVSILKCFQSQSDCAEVGEVVIRREGVGLLD